MKRSEAEAKMLSTGGKVVALGAPRPSKTSQRRARSAQVHNVLYDGCESRDNHRYAVVVQDLATR